MLESLEAIPLLQTFHATISEGHLEKLPYCKQTKAESAALP
jgi:hypothetical protein